MQAPAPGTWAFLILVSVLIIGLVVLVKSSARLASKVAFTAQYREQVAVLVEHANIDVYEWLTLNANRMQGQMGSQGLVTFRPPFANHVIQNYPVVLNVLAELRNCLSDDLLSGNLLHQYHSLLNDALLRHQGSLIERHEHAFAAVKNPFAWLTTGIRTLLAAPLWLLAAVGVISHSVASRITSSSFYRVISGLVTLIGLISAIVGLVTGWEQFLVILRKVM